MDDGECQNGFVIPSRAPPPSRKAAVEDDEESTNGLVISSRRRPDGGGDDDDDGRNGFVIPVSRASSRRFGDQDLVSPSQQAIDRARAASAKQRALSPSHQPPPNTATLRPNEEAIRRARAASAAQRHRRQSSSSEPRDGNALLSARGGIMSSTHSVSSSQGTMPLPRGPPPRGPPTSRPQSALFRGGPPPPRGPPPRGIGAPPPSMMMTTSTMMATAPPPSSRRTSSASSSASLFATAPPKPFAGAAPPRPVGGPPPGRGAPPPPRGSAVPTTVVLAPRSSAPPPRFSSSAASSSSSLASSSSSSPKGPAALLGAALPPRSMLLGRGPPRPPPGLGKAPPPPRTASPFSTWHGAGPGSPRGIITWSAPTIPRRPSVDGEMRRAEPRAVVSRPATGGGEQQGDLRRPSTGQVSATSRPHIALPPPNKPPRSAVAASRPPPPTEDPPGWSRPAPAGPPMKPSTAPQRRVAPPLAGIRPQAPPPSRPPKPLGTSAAASSSSSSSSSSLDPGAEWKCALCGRANAGAAGKCSCCGRTRASATDSAAKLWAGPRVEFVPQISSRPRPPPKAPPPQNRPNTVEVVDEAETQRRLMYYRRRWASFIRTHETSEEASLFVARPPPKRRGPPMRISLAPKVSDYATAAAPPPRSGRKPTPRPPGGKPPGYAVRRRPSSEAHSVEGNRHFTARFHDDFSTRGDQPLALRERDRRLRTNAPPEGIVLSELCTIGGVPCAVTVVQREWRVVIHAVDLERGDEYSATSELHASYVQQTAPTPDQRLALYRELVAACAFKSTLATQGRKQGQKLHRKLVVSTPRGVALPLKVDGAVVFMNERLVVSDTMMKVGAVVRHSPDIVEVRLEDMASKLTTTLTFPLGAAPGLAGTARARLSVGRADALYETPWAATAAGRAAGQLYEPLAERVRVAMAVELVCSELVASVVEENMKTTLRVTPSAALVASIADACRKHRAAVLIEAQVRGLVGRRGAATQRDRRRKGDVARLAAREEAATAVTSLFLRVRPRKELQRRRAAAAARNQAARSIARLWRRRRKYARHGAARTVQLCARRSSAKRALAHLVALAADRRKAKKVAAIAMAKERDRRREAAKLQRLCELHTARNLQLWARRCAADRAARRAKAGLVLTRAAQTWLVRREARRARAARDRAANQRRREAEQQALRRTRQMERDRLEREKVEAAELAHMARCEAQQRRVEAERRHIDRAAAAKCVTDFFVRAHLRRTRWLDLARRRADLLDRASAVAALAAEMDARDAALQAALRDCEQERILAAVEAGRAAAGAAQAAREATARAMSALRALAYERRTRDLSRDAAVVAVQAAWRRALARRQRAARVIQRSFGAKQRVRRARAEVAAKRRTRRAAAAIQRCARGAASRRATALRLADRERRRAGERRDRERVAREKADRDRAAREALLDRQKAQREADAEQRRQAEAATAIEGLFRCGLARRRATALRAALAGRAATRIQAAARRAAATARVHKRLRDCADRDRAAAEAHAAALAEAQAEQDRLAWEAAAAEEEEEAANAEAWRVWAAQQIQAWWRGLVAARAARSEAAWCNWAAGAIQFAWRDHRRRKYGTPLAPVPEGEEEPLDLSFAPLPDLPPEADDDGESDDDDDEPFVFDENNKDDVDLAFTWVRHGRRDKLRKYCQGGFDVDMRNEHGHSLAMVAAQNNQKSILKVLYKSGVAMNDQDYRGNTALHYATQYGYTKLGEYMIQKLGADERVTNHQGTTCWLSIAA